MSCFLNCFPCCRSEEGPSNSPGSLYQDSPCCSKSTIYDLAVGGTGAVAIIGGAFSPPPINFALISGGITLLTGNTTRAVIACCSEDRALREQLDRFGEQLETFKDETNNLGNLTGANQQLADKFAAFARRMREGNARVAQLDEAVDQGALQAVKERFEAASLIYAQMARTMSATCGGLDRMQAAVEERFQTGRNAADAANSLARIAGDLGEFSADQEERLRQMQESVARYQQVQERLPAFFEAFGRTLNAIRQANVGIQNSTAVIEAQVQALREAKDAADRQAGEANARADEAKAAAARITTQLEELRRTQDVEITRLKEQITGLERIIQIVKEKAGEDTLRGWVEDKA